MEEAVGRGEPAEVTADGDLARVVGRSPGQPDSRLKVGSAAPLGRVGLRVEEPLHRPGRRGEDCYLLGEAQRIALLHGGPELREPQPQVARTREVREPHGRERTRTAFRYERRLLSEQQLCARPRDDADRAPQAEQRKGASSCGRLLPAVEVHVELARKTAVQHVRVGDEDTESRLTDGAAGRARRRKRVHELGHVDVVDARVGEEAIHEHQPGELHRPLRFGRLRGSGWRRLRRDRQSDGDQRDEHRGPHLGLLAVSV